MKNRLMWAALSTGLAVVVTAAWMQEPAALPVKAQVEPPSYCDVLKSHVGEKCGVRRDGGVWYLHFPEDRKMNWESVTLMAAGSDFVQLLDDGRHRYIPLERIELWVKP